MRESTGFMNTFTVHIKGSLVAAFSGALLADAGAEDWGAYSIVPVSAPNMALEAVGGTNEGDVVSINKPSGAANQKWIVVPKGDGWFWIMPSSKPTLALTVANGETKTGAKIRMRCCTRASSHGPRPFVEFAFSISVQIARCSTEV